MAPVPDDSDLLCLQGLQHAFVLTEWESLGASSHWSSELMCPTCGTVVSRAGPDAGWRWISPDPTD